MSNILRFPKFDLMASVEKIIFFLALLFVFLIPLQTRLILQEGSMGGVYWEYGTISIYATEMILLVIFVLIGFRFYTGFKKQKIQFSKKMFFSFYGAGLLFVVFAGASIFWSRDMSVATERWIALSEGVALFMIISFLGIDYKKLLWVALFSAVIQSVLGIAEFLLQSVPASSFFGMSNQNPANMGVSVVETELRRWLRAYGSFPHPNILGGSLVICLALLTFDLKRKREVVWDDLRISVFAVLLFGLFCTFSRSAILGFCVFLFLFVLRMLIGSRFMEAGKIVLIFSVCCAMFLALFYEPALSRVSKSGRLEIKSSQERVSLFKESFLVINSSPFFGAGIGNYGFATIDLEDVKKIAYQNEPVHNAFLLVLSELGFFGVLILLFAFVLFFLEENRFVAILGAVPVFVISFFDHYFWTLYPGIMMICFYFGMLVLMKKQKYNIG